MSKFIKIITILVIAFSIIGITSCFEDDPEQYTVRVINTNGTFDGFFIYNTNPPIAFAGAVLSGNQYYYSFTMDKMDTIYVSATMTGGAATTLSIYIYDEDGEVASDNIYDSDGDTTLTLSYSPGDSEAAE